MDDSDGQHPGCSAGSAKTARKERCEWLCASDPPLLSNSEPFDVEVSIAIIQLVLDTKSLVATIDYDVTYLWTDTRLAGWTSQLPSKLWGPRFQPCKTVNLLTEMDLTFELVDPSKGRLKRITKYTGAIVNDMDLQYFPFDADGIFVEMITFSGWRSKDCQDYGESPFGRTYNVQLGFELEGLRCEPVKGVFRGGVPEWEVLGVSYMCEPKTLPSGAQPTLINVGVHASRKSSYYFWKVLLPLYMLALLCVTTFMLPVEELSDRMGLVATYFLASFAMLYVVGEFLPKTDFMTKVDWVIISTTVSIVLVGVAMSLLLWMTKYAEEDVVTWWNNAIAYAISSSYAVSNVYILAEALYHQRKILNGLATRPGPSNTVPEGFKYVRLDVRGQGESAGPRASLRASLHGTASGPKVRARSLGQAESE